MRAAVEWRRVFQHSLWSFVPLSVRRGLRGGGPARGTVARCGGPAVRAVRRCGRCGGGSVGL